MTAELIALTEELRVTTQMLGKVTARLDEADRRANRHRIWTGILALCVLANALLFGLFYRDDQSDDTSTCLRANATRADIREAIAETVRTVTADSDNPERVAAYLAEIDKNLRKTLPNRDC